MKNLNISNTCFSSRLSVLWYLEIITLLCLGILAISLGCEKADQYNTSSSDTSSNLPIDTRGECEECPDEDECCCLVYLYHDNYAEIALCGTSDGAGMCSGDDTCPVGSFSNGYQTKTLVSLDPELAFCVIKERAFWIENLDAMDGADLKITCRNDYVGAQTLTIHLNASDKKYFETDDECFLSECP
jgi:hypothetical protein